ncbi:MAG: HlyD family efflux transporter periplasmic adaptor subunit, partial [Clostridia bacterium]|nr:HlyD family efflux transporter periplasmic adaptor subunit [Clostridia bacterium]
MKRKKKKWIRRLVWLAILVLLGCGFWFIGLPMLRQSVTTTYDTYTATIGSISNDLSFSGSFALKNQETLTASAPGTVRAVYVEAGEKVKSGDRLVRLSNGETVKASIDGTVNTLDVAAGDDVTGGQQLCQVADFSTQSVSIRVDEYDIGEVSVGQTCTVTATSQERSFDAVITAINYVSQSTGNVAYYTATADVEVDEGIYPGMQATITIPKASVENVVILKMDALSFDRTNQAYVYMKDEGDELKQVNVELGIDNESYVEIKSGLKDGDTVYVEAKAEETATGFAALFSGMQRNQFNAERGNNRGNWSGGSGN